MVAPDVPPGDVAVGVLGKPVGLRGEVHVHPDVDFDVDFAPGLECRTTRARPGDVGDPAVPLPATLVVSASRLHGGRLVVHFEGVDDRETADALRGTVISLARTDVALDEDAIWASELLGREVVDDDGAIVGVVEGMLDGPAHDYLVLARPDGGEVLVPAVVDLVEVGPEQIVVHAIPGLLDPDS